MLATASAQVCVPLGHSSLYFEMCLRVWTTSLRGCAAIGFQLNTAKNEVLWCVTSRQQRQFPREATCVGNDFVQTAGWVRDLGLFSRYTSRSVAEPVCQTSLAGACSSLW